MGRRGSVTWGEIAADEMWWTPEGAAVAQALDRSHWLLAFSHKLEERERPRRILANG